MPDPSSSPTVVAVVAVITGERGQREIVRPLAAVGISCAVIDWEELRAHGGSPYARFIPKLAAIVRAHPGAPVFTDMSSAFLALILLAAKFHGSPVLLRLRGDPFAETQDQLRFHWQQREWPQLARAIVSWLLDRPLFTAVDRFVPVSDWIVRRLGIADRASIVRIPVPVDQFPERHHRASSPLRLFVVTNFNYPQKVAATGRFLESYGDFLKEQNFTVSIAGAGIALDTFRERHAGHAEFLGFVRDVPRRYAEYDIFIHFSDLDAFPYVVLEAQAAGLPVIVNRDCGMLEQVEDTVTGYIVDLENRSSVEGRLLALRDSISLRTEVGARARQSILDHYNLAAIGRDLAKTLPPQTQQEADSTQRRKDAKKQDPRPA